MGKLFGKSEIVGSADRYGTTGASMVRYQGKYYLFYIGIPTQGYEGFPCRLCLAVNDNLSPNGWIRNGVVIDNDQSIDWTNKQVYHSFFMKKNDLWYCFFNAHGTVNGFSSERTGFLG